MSSTITPAVPAGFTFDQGMTPDTLGMSDLEMPAFPALSSAFNSGSVPAVPASGNAASTSGTGSSAAPGSWASQPAGVKIAVYAVAVGLVLIGLLGLVLPAAEKAAPAIAAAG
jgi:hypothetical protein